MVPQEDAIARRSEDRISLVPIGPWWAYKTIVHPLTSDTAPFDQFRIFGSVIAVKSGMSVKLSIAIPWWQDPNGFAEAWMWCNNPSSETFALPDIHRIVLFLFNRRDVRPSSLPCRHAIETAMRMNGFSEELVMDKLPVFYQGLMLLAQELR